MVRLSSSTDGREAQQLTQDGRKTRGQSNEHCCPSVPPPRVCGVISKKFKHRREEEDGISEVMDPLDHMNPHPPTNQQGERREIG